MKRLSVWFKIGSLLAVLIGSTVPGSLPVAAPSAHSTSFLSEALALNAKGGRWRSLLEAARPFWPGWSVVAPIRNTPDPDSNTSAIASEYFAEQERLEQEVDARIERGEELVIPPGTVTHTALDENGKPVKSATLNIFSFPHREMVNELAAVQDRIRQNLQTLIARDIPDTVAAEQVYRDMLDSLYFVDPNPDDVVFHQTLASIQNVHPGRFQRLRMWLLRLHIIQRTREIAQFRRMIFFKYIGKLIFFIENGSPAVAVFLEPDTESNARRREALTGAYGSHLRVKYELPHSTVLYVRGQLREDKRWTLTPTQFRWLQTAVKEAQRERLEIQHVEKWRVLFLDVCYSAFFGDVSNVVSVALRGKEVYEGAVADGQEWIAREWGLHSPDALDENDEDGVPRSAKLDALRGLFRQYQLKDLTALYAAIGFGAIEPKEIMQMLQHSDKVKVDVERVIVEVDGKKIATNHYIFRVTTRDSRPGLVLSVARTMDLHQILPQSMKILENGVEFYAAHLYRDGQVAQLKRHLEQIPDLAIRRGGWRRRLLNWIHDLIHFREKMVPVSIEMKFKAEFQDEESTLSRLLQAFREQDPRSQLMRFDLEREGNMFAVRLKVLLPESLSGRLRGQLDSAVGNWAVPEPGHYPLRFKLLLKHLGFEGVLGWKLYLLAHPHNPNESDLMKWFLGMALPAKNNEDVVSFASGAPAIFPPHLSVDELEILHQQLWLALTELTTEENITLHSASRVRDLSYGELSVYPRTVVSVKGIDHTRHLQFHIVERQLPASFKGVYFLIGYKNSNPDDPVRSPSSYVVQIPASVIRQGGLAPLLQEIIQRTGYRSEGFSEKATLELFKGGGKLYPDSMDVIETIDANPFSPGLLYQEPKLAPTLPLVRTSS